MNGKLRMTELFAGIGAQKAAMDMAKIECETIVCEIDDKAYRSYCAIHGDTPNLGDITKVIGFLLRMSYFFLGLVSQFQSKGVKLA